MPSSNTILANALRSFERVFGFTQLITEPTSACNNSESANNLSCLVTDREKVCQSGVLGIGISDHLITYCARKVNRALVNKHNTFGMR